MEEAVKAKKGYSIWSLLVIMTLLAVLLSIPKPKSEILGPLTHTCFVAAHQLALWVLFGTLVWMILGKRRSVFFLECFVVVIIWGPLFAALAEDLISGSGRHAVVRGFLKPIGLYDAYGEMYRWIFRTFGYGTF